MTTYTAAPAKMHSGHDIRDERGHMVAIVHNPKANRAEGAKIAALMAAAPKLLAALEALVKEPLRYNNDTIEIQCLSHKDAMQFIRDARAAIARAQGAAH